MRDAGISFGAHTRYHAWLDRVSPDELVRELREAKQKIESELEQSCDILAYPNGNHNAAVRAAAAAEGYRYAMTQDRGINRAGTDPLALYRIEVPFDERLGSFICRSAGFTFR
jgi:peptidoglycan/xylan/chitin deacetylase (PgdA/CDA1 family)